MALARQVAGTNTLAPIARLELLDDQATITQTAPNITFGIGLALLAGIVAGVGVGFFLLPYRARRSAGETVLAAVKEAGRSPVAVLHADDPLFSHRSLHSSRPRPARCASFRSVPSSTNEPSTSEGVWPRPRLR